MTPGLRFIGPAQRVDGMPLIRTAENQPAARPEKVGENLDNFFIPGDVLESLRADDLVEFSIELSEVIDVHELKLRPLARDVKKIEEGSGGRHLPLRKRNSENSVSLSIGGVA